MAEKVATRIEVFEPGAEKALMHMTVPGEVVIDQVRKSLKVAIELIIDVGDKKKKKSATVKIRDESLLRAIEEYVDSLVLKLTAVRTQEEIIGEAELGEVKTLEE